MTEKKVLTIETDVPTPEAKVEVTSVIETAYGKAQTIHGTPYGEHLEPLPSGQQKDYVVLTPEERAKGFVRPVRRQYKHVGRRPKYPTRSLTPEERERYNEHSYEVWETYPPELAPKLGRLWTKEELNSGCGTVTTMGLALCETYAREPKFYSGTFCAGCGKHFPVGEDGEFVWVEDGQKVGT
jgi:hypothetical protein